MQNTFSCPIISAISFQRGPLEEGLLHTRCAEPIGKLSEFARTFMPEGSGAGDAIPYPTSSDGGSANISLQQKRKQRIMSAFTLRVLAAASVPDTALCRISYGRMGTFSLRETACSVIDASIYARKKQSPLFIIALLSPNIKDLFSSRKGILLGSIHWNMRENKC